MEETIGYEALFTSEEWDAIQSNTYYDVMAEEAELEFGSVSPQGDPIGTKHDVNTYKTDRGYEIECELCGNVGLADDEALAQVLTNFHETLQAMVTEAAAQ